MFQEMSVFVVLSYVGSSHLWVWQRFRVQGLGYLTGYQSWAHLDMQTRYHLPTSAIQATFALHQRDGVSQICAGYGCGGNKYCGREDGETATTI